MRDLSETNKKIEELHEEYYAVMYFEAYKITNDHFLAEDVRQEVMLKIYNNLYKIDEIKNPRTKKFIMKIVKNTALRLIKKNKNKDIPLEDNLNIASDLNVEEKMIECEMIEVLCQKLNGLTKNLREAMILHHLEGNSIEEIAVILDIKEATVRKRLQRGKKELIERVEKSERGGKLHQIKMRLLRDKKKS